MDQILEKEAVASLIPQKGRMSLIHRITSWDLSTWTLTSETKLSADFMFFDPETSTIPTWSSFELIAQSIAALTSIDCRLNGKPQNMGMILSVSSMHFSLPCFKSGQTAVVTVHRESEVDTIFSFTGTVTVDGIQAASGKITVMEAGPEAFTPSGAC